MGVENFKSWDGATYRAKDGSIKIKAVAARQGVTAAKLRAAFGPPPPDIAKYFHGQDNPNVANPVGAQTPVNAIAPQAPAGPSKLVNVSPGNGLGAPAPTGPQNALVRYRVDDGNVLPFRTDTVSANPLQARINQLVEERRLLTETSNKMGGLASNAQRILAINDEINKLQYNNETNQAASALAAQPGSGFFSPTGQQFAGPTPVDMAHQGGGRIPTAADAAKDPRFGEQLRTDIARGNMASGESVFDPSLSPGAGRGGVGGVPIKEAIEGPAPGTLAAQNPGGLPVGEVIVGGGTVAAAKGAQGDKTPDGKQTTSGPTGSSTGPGSGGMPVGGVVPTGTSSPGGTTVNNSGGVPVGDVIPDGSTTPGSQNTNGGTTVPVPTGGGGTNVTLPTGGGGVTIPGGGGIDWLGLTAILGSGLYGAAQGKDAAKLQADAARDVAQKQYDATIAGQTINEQQFNAAMARDKEIYNQQIKRQKPWMEAGGRALTGLEAFDQNNPQFQADPFKFEMTPGSAQDKAYAFRLSEGMKALQNSAAAKGMLQSGNTLKGITQYGQGMASQEYENAFNRYQTDTANRFNRFQSQRGEKLNAMQSLAGVGQSSVQQMNQAGSNYANSANQSGQNYSNNAGQYSMAGANALGGGISGAANANASGLMGQSNAITNAVSAGINYNQSNQLMNALMNRR